MPPVVISSGPLRFILPFLIAASFAAGCRGSQSDGSNGPVNPKEAANFAASLDVPEGESASIGTYTGTVTYPDGRQFEISGERNGMLAAYWLQDLGGNEAPELVIWMVGAGSGSYASIHIYWMNDDGPMLDDVSELPHGAGGGYMGHDSVFVADGKLKRCFPQYEAGDPNAQPSGANRCLTFDSLMGWIISG